MNFSDIMEKQDVAEAISEHLDKSIENSARELIVSITENEFKIRKVETPPINLQNEIVEDAAQQLIDSVKKDLKDSFTISLMEIFSTDCLKGVLTFCKTPAGLEYMSHSKMLSDKFSKEFDLHFKSLKLAIKKSVEICLKEFEAAQEEQEETDE